MPLKEITMVHILYTLAEIRESGLSKWIKNIYICISRIITDDDNISASIAVRSCSFRANQSLNEIGSMCREYPRISSLDTVQSNLNKYREAYIRIYVYLYVGYTSAFKIQLS